MTTVDLAQKVAASEVRIVLPNISWQSYERLLADLSNQSIPHLTYDRGELEIMSPTAQHEKINRSIEVLVATLAFEMKLEYVSLGSTTFKREDLRRGFEPDSCFYFKNCERIKGKAQIDLTMEPPPDVVVEIDITSPSIEKLSIFAEFGVPEMWRYREGTMQIFILDQGAYVPSSNSAALQFLDVKTLTDFVNQSLKLDSIEWMQVVLKWVGKVKGSDLQ